MAKEKQKYVSADIELIKFNSSDVISTSQAYIEDDNSAWV